MHLWHIIVAKEDVDIRLLRFQDCDGLDLISFQYIFPNQEGRFGHLEPNAVAFVVVVKILKYGL